MKKAIPFVIVLGLIAIVFLPRLLGAGKPLCAYVNESFSMGAVARITVFAPNDSADSVKTAVDAAFSAMQDVNATCSLYRDDSDIVRVNAGNGPVFVSGTFRRCLEMAIEANRLTDGIFDPTVGPMLSLWGFGKGAEGVKKVPSDSETAQAMALLGCANIHVDSTGKVSLDKPGAKLDLNGIAQGYGTDLASEELIKAKVVNALIETGGGEFRAIGRSGGTHPFKIEIKKPRRGAEGCIATLELEDCSIATSGDYEKYFEIDGVQYSHLFDPRTGKPKTSQRTSVTVIGPLCAVCDYLATTAAILKPEEALALIARFAGYDVIVAIETADGPKFFTSSGIEKIGEGSFRKKAGIRTNGK